MARTPNEVAALIAPSLGDEKARAIVADTARSLGMTSAQLENAQCLRLLDAIALQPGIVGISARFAKSRFHLLND
jgi:hypothetical protein